MTKLRLPVFALGMVLNMSLAHASYIAYSAESAFQAAAGPTSTTTFDGIAPAGNAVPFGNGNSIGGVTITASDFQLFVVSSSFPCQGVTACGLGTGDFMEGSYYQQCCGAGTTTFAPIATTYALALDYRAYDQQPSLPNDSAGTFSVSVNGGASFTLTSTAVSNFIGFVSTTPIVSVSFTPTGGQPNPGSYAEFFHFDNLETGISATPEPGTFALIGLGIAGVGLFRRRLR